MKALTLTALGGAENLVVQEVPKSEITEPGQALIRIYAAGLNHLDLFVLGGLPGVTYTFPHIMGADGAGVIEAVSPDVQGWKPGDRVMFNPGLSCFNCGACLVGEHPLCTSYRLVGEHVSGCIAEYVTVPARNLGRVPERMPWHQAAGFSLVTLTAWRMLVSRAQLRAGETVLIWGIGGGVSLAALQIAKLCGAQVIATSSSDEKLARARELGADYTVNHVRDDVPAEVRKLTGRRGVDVVAENVGEKTWERSLRCLARKGRLVTCGGTSGPMVVTDVRKLFWSQWSILGSTMGSYGEYQEIVRLAHQGKLWPVIDAVFPLARAADAFARLTGGRQLGKLVIEVTS